MSVMDTIRSRHSVRDYLPDPIGPSTLSALQAIVDECAEKSGLNIQLVTDNPEAFNVIASFGLIKGAACHIAFVTRGKSEDEAIGYWGQKIVLDAQELGLNTCWAAIISRKKSKARCKEDEKLRLGIAVGYGRTPGVARRTKSVEQLSVVKCDTAPDWFTVAMEAAQLAPTAMNNQNFKVTLQADGETVRIEAPLGGLNIIDLGIVKRNFELAADELGARWKWA